MKLGVMGSQFIREATKQRFYPSGRPVRDTTGRPVQFFTHHPQPRVDAEDPLGSLILLARDLDLDAVEFSLRSYLAPAELTRIGNLLAKHGVILATGYGDDWSAPKRPPEEFRAYVQAAKQLGVNVVHVGGMPFSINRFVDDPSFPRQMELIRSALRPLVEIAEAEGIILTIENHADYRCDELLEHVIQPLGSRRLGFKLDTGNCPLVIDEPVAAARVVAPLCYDTHFKDMHVMPVTPDGGKIVGAPLGRGSCQLDQVARILAENAPAPDNLLLSIEIGWMPPNEDYFQWLHESIAWCRRELAPYLIRSR
ncbi:MAG TPA: sugar phosphate isomerase/epimerase family protein [Chloroflexota bacterium]|nr:sugar phosphate isomerase/epimerase family protein [Chloroflexota bacterium]